MRLEVTHFGLTYLEVSDIPYADYYYGPSVDGEYVSPNGAVVPA